MGSSHSYLQNLEGANKMTMFNVKEGACYQYDILETYANIARSTGSTMGTCAGVGYKVEGESYPYAGLYQGHKWVAMVTNFSMGGLQELCDGSDCNQMHFLQNLYQAQNLVHWVIEDKCYEKAVPANIMKAVLTAPINGLSGGCVVGGFTQAVGEVSANVASFGDVVLDAYVAPSMMI